MDPDTQCFMAMTKGDGADPTSARPAWIPPLLGALENVNGNDHPKVLKAQLQGICPASLGAWKGQVERKNHRDLLQRKFLWVSKQWVYCDIFLGVTAGLAQPGEELKFCLKELCTFLAPGKRKCLGT